MKRVKKKYQTPVTLSIEVGLILPIAASPGGVTIPGGGNASGGGGGGGTPPPMQSPPRNFCGSGFLTEDDDETADEIEW